MRKNLLLIFVFVSSIAMAQSPEKFTYQCVIRDAAENLIQNSNVGIQISIRRDSPSGPIIFQEQHNDSTNQNGLAALEIGSGTVIIGTFSSIEIGVTDPTSLKQVLTHLEEQTSQLLEFLNS